MRKFCTLVLATVAIAATAGCAGGDDEATSTTTTTEAVTLTTSPDVEPLALGDQILVLAGARQAVFAGDGAEERIAELGAAWCTTALRSDVENADATFRFSMNEYFTEWGVVSNAGEVQDVPLGKAMLAGQYAEPLARASNELLCPEVVRPTD